MTVNKTELSVRLATTVDAINLARIFEVIEAQTITTAQALDWLEAARGLETPFLAEQGGHVVGMACLRMAPPFPSAPYQAEIVEMYVQQGPQLPDIEQAILMLVEVFARQAGARHLCLLTGLKNADAQARYRLLGYREYAIAMRKSLNGC